MPEPAFLVEGQMEQKIIQKLCTGKVVRLIGCNGDNASMAAVAKALNAHIRLLKNFSPIVIIFDRERREESCNELMEALSNILDNQYGYKGRYILSIADRTTENWILADWGHASLSLPGCRPFTGALEGSHGKTEIRKLMPEDVLYHETTVGVALFLKCRPRAIRGNSQSFANFISSISFDCWWLKQIQDDESALF